MSKIFSPHSVVFDVSSHRNDEKVSRRSMVSGWWIVPSVIFGALGWYFLLTWLF